MIALIVTSLVVIGLMGFSIWWNRLDIRQLYRGWESRVRSEALTEQRVTSTLDRVEDVYQFCEAQQEMIDELILMNLNSCLTSKNKTIRQRAKSLYNKDKKRT